MAAIATRLPTMVAVVVVVRCHVIVVIPAAVANLYRLLCAPAQQNSRAAVLVVERKKCGQLQQHKLSQHHEQL